MVTQDKPSYARHLAHHTVTVNRVLPSLNSVEQSVPLTGTSTMTADLYRLPDLTHPYRYVSTGGAATAGS